MAKATKQVQTIERPQVQPSNDGVKDIRIRDAFARLKTEVVYPLATLSDLLVSSDADFVAGRDDPQTATEALGWLLDAVVAKAEQILREHGLSEDED